MDARLLAFIALCLPRTLLTEEGGGGCTIRFECPECLPEHVPAVSGGAGERGTVLVAEGAEVALSCGGGRFLAYPGSGAITARCARGLYFVGLDNATRPLLELGCRESVFEDVAHQVEGCAPPLQGRAYQLRESSSRTVHLATVCFDSDLGVAAHAVATGAALALPPHEHRASPLSLLGNLGEMFDAGTRRAAERLFADEAGLERRVRERFARSGFSFAAQTLTSGRLLAASYWEARLRPAAEFASNRVAVWRSVAEGNLRALHADVARALRRGRGGLRAVAGTHGVGALRTSPPVELYLREGGRFPVPRYLWTAVVAEGGRAGLALALLNDPFVTVSEIREAVFCESSCSRARWLRELLRDRNYERPLAGLVFCCELAAFARLVPEMPRIFDAAAAPLYELP